MICWLFFKKKNNYIVNDCNRGWMKLNRDQNGPIIRLDFPMQTQWNVLVKAEFRAPDVSECLHWLWFPPHLSVAPAKVQVYSRDPAEFGKKNVLICHASGFHPPDITIQLMKGEDEMMNANQTDLAFADDWHFHLTKSVFFTPKAGEHYTCKVTHGSVVSPHTWGELQSPQADWTNWNDDGNMLTVFWMWLDCHGHYCWGWFSPSPSFSLLQSQTCKAIFTSSPATRRTFLLRSKFGFQFSWLHWRAASPLNHFAFLFLMLSETITTSSCLGLPTFGLF